MADNKTFVIDGEDYKKLMEFKKKHEKCWERHPNLTGGPGLQYSYVEDSIGILKSVRCICGATCFMTDDYDLTVDKLPIKPFRVIPEDRKTAELIRLLRSVDKRPGMYFGKVRSYTMLRVLLFAYSYGANITGEEFHWASMDTEILDEMQKITSDREYSDEEQYYKFFEAFKTVLNRDYTEYLQELGIGEIK